MLETPTRSWAAVVSGATPAPTVTSERGREFSWKAGKNNHCKPVKPACNGIHCEELETRCSRPECQARQERMLNVVKSENNALTSSLETRLSGLADLRAEIVQQCKTEDFSSIEMEQSRLAVVKANREKIAPVFCECTACQLGYEQEQSRLLHKRLSAAQARLTALRAFRLANDRDTLYRTSESCAHGGKYFTPVGSTKAKGVTALRPMLQMQSSYDVAAMTMNSMEARRIKIAWKDKPKPAST